MILSFGKRVSPNVFPFFLYSLCPSFSVGEACFLCWGSMCPSFSVGKAWCLLSLVFPLLGKRGASVGEACFLLALHQIFGEACLRNVVSFQEPFGKRVSPTVFLSLSLSTVLHHDNASVFDASVF